MRPAWLRDRPRWYRRSLTLLAAVVAAVSLAGVGRAQSGISFGSVMVWPAGWNLLSFAGDTNFSGDVSTIGTLYTLAPGAASYTVTDLSHVQVGTGYWAYFPRRVLWLLRTGSRQSFSVSVPAGSCAMVGNPGTAGSARVMGADRVYVWSPLLNSYVQESLLGIGRAAWACNDGADTVTVTVSDQGDVLTPSFPDCCRPQVSGTGGQVLLSVQNASPYPLGAVMEPLDAQGNAPQNATTYYAIENACNSCQEYGGDGPGAATCDSAAVEGQTFVTPPGRYLLHMQSDGRNVPDLQTVIDLQANTSYHLCYFVTATRPQRDLP